MAESGAAEYTALHLLMQEHTPACNGDDRYIADELSPADKRALADTCNKCPLLEACAAYANKAKPRAGYWGNQALKAKGTNR